MSGGDIMDYVKKVGKLTMNETARSLANGYSGKNKLKDTEVFSSIRLQRKVKEMGKNKEEFMELMTLEKELHTSIQKLFEFKCPSYYT